MKQLILTTILLVSAGLQLNAQIGINLDGSPADASAMLDVSSTNKGLLTPRMTTAQREAIVSPAEGLSVFDTDEGTFWYYANTQWNEILNSADSITYENFVDSFTDYFRACPEEKSSLDLGGSLSVVERNNDYLYIGNAGTNEFLVVNISDVQNPTQVGSLAIESAPFSMAVNSNYAYLIDEDGSAIKVVDISNPNAPQFEDSLSIGSSHRDIRIAGNYLYLLDRGDDDLKSIYIGNLDSVEVVFSLPLSLNPRRMDISGDYIYIVNGNTDELEVVDISDPTNLIKVGSVGNGNFMNNVTAAGDYAYATDNNLNVFTVFNVSDPAAPFIEGSLNIEGAPSDMEVFGDHVFVLEGFDEILQIININDPANPFLESKTSLGDSPISFVVDETYAYIVHEGASQDLRIISSICPQVLTVDPTSGELQLENLLWTKNDSSNSIVSYIPVAIGSVGIGAESDDQAASDQAGKGFLSTPWLYTTAIQAPKEFNTQPTAIILGKDGYISGPDEIHLLTSGNTVLMVDENQNVGIGTTNPGYKLQVGEQGDGTEARANAWNNLSDQRLKRNIRPISDPLQKVQALNGYYYFWNETLKDQSRQVGVIAQEVEAVLPEIVHTDAEGIKSLNYSKLTALLIEADKALLTEMEAFEEANKNFEATLQQIQAALDSGN